jgi:hypothetical protein
MMAREACVYFISEVHFSRGQIDREIVRLCTALKNRMQRGPVPTPRCIRNNLNRFAMQILYSEILFPSSTALLT